MDFNGSPLYEYFHDKYSFNIGEERKKPEFFEKLLNSYEDGFLSQANQEMNYWDVMKKHNSIIKFLDKDQVVKIYNALSVNELNYNDKKVGYFPMADLCSVVLHVKFPKDCMFSQYLNMNDDFDAMNVDGGSISTFRLSIARSALNIETDKGFNSLKNIDNFAFEKALSSEKNDRNKWIHVFLTQQENYLGKFKGDQEPYIRKLAEHSRRKLQSLIVK